MKKKNNYQNNDNSWYKHHGQTRVPTPKRQPLVIKPNGDRLRILELTVDGQVEKRRLVRVG